MGGKKIKKLKGEKPIKEINRRTGTILKIK